MKGSKERLFIRTKTHSLKTFGVIPFAKLQNDTYTTVKQLKTIKNEMRRELSFLIELCCFSVQCLEEFLPSTGNEMLLISLACE